MISFTAWNAAKGAMHTHEAYKKVLVKLAHFYADEFNQMKSNVKIILPIQHALSSPNQTHNMIAKSGKCKRCSTVFQLKTRTVHYCVQCSSNSNIVWMCLDCFKNIHNNPAFVKKPLYLTTKPISQQGLVYSAYQ